MIAQIMIKTATTPLTVGRRTFLREVLPFPQVDNIVLVNVTRETLAALRLKIFALE